VLAPVVLVRGLLPRAKCESKSGALPAAATNRKTKIPPPREFLAHTDFLHGLLRSRGPPWPCPPGGGHPRPTRALHSEAHRAAAVARVIGAIRCGATRESRMPLGRVPTTSNVSSPGDYEEVVHFAVTHPVGAPLEPRFADRTILRDEPWHSILRTIQDKETNRRSPCPRGTVRAEHCVYIPSDHRTFFAMHVPVGGAQHESGSASFGISYWPSRCARCHQSTNQQRRYAKIHANAQ
jgi:hypothetical protein